jgi:hypothetical protein
MDFEISLLLLKIVMSTGCSDRFEWVPDCCFDKEDDRLLPNILSSFMIIFSPTLRCTTFALV